MSLGFGGPGHSQRCRWHETVLVSSGRLLLEGEHFPLTMYKMTAGADREVAEKEKAG